MEEEIKTTRPETPSLDNVSEKKEEQSEVVQDISKRLSGDEKVDAKEGSDEPVAKKAPPVTLSQLSTEQIQDLQDMMAETPRRITKKESYHTIELREIEGKVIVEWGKSYFDLKHDSTQRRDIMKTMLPVRFHGEDKFVDVLWAEEFMQANRVTCRIIKMDREDYAETTGDTTFKRSKDGEQTGQEVEMYVNKTKVTLTVKLPNGEEAVLDGSFAN